MAKELMQWSKLVSPKRLCRPDDSASIDQERSPFQRDFDRIIFSAPFRQLQDKTQVFPLEESDYVRTRLTHSLEVASIARSLGTATGVHICKNYDTAGAQPSDIGAIVAAAALGHDIGNPPLGHGGEEAIRYWFTDSEVGKKLHLSMSVAERADIANYEGNAHGFRVMSVLQMPDQAGGMQLTCATLGAFAKYPHSSNATKKAVGVGGKKYNFFQSERELFKEVAINTGLIELSKNSYCRHPLTFLVEAADDIAYRIVDFEDAHMLGIIPYEELEEYFLAIINRPHFKESLANLSTNVAKVKFLRAKVIGELVQQSAKYFCEHQEQFLAGEVSSSLIDSIASGDVLAKITERSVQAIYNSPRVSTIIAAGFELISSLLDLLVPAVNEVAEEVNGGKKASYRAKRLIKIIPERFAPVDSPVWLGSTYLRLLFVLDYITGMTDSSAVSLHKKLKGISL